MNEQVNALVNDKITFTYPWVLELPPPETDVDEPRINFSKTMITSYNVASFNWYLQLSSRHIVVSQWRMYKLVASCKISYKVFTDNDMQTEILSSSTIASSNDGSFFTPNGFLEKFYDLFKQGNIAKIVILVELSIPMKYFNRPFDSTDLNKKHCNEYPEDMEKNFRFEFLKDGDYSVKCPDGSISALRMVLNVSSKFMEKHLEESKDVEMVVVEHSIDVVKPIILYLHSLCFEMPKSFDFDYADRLLEAIDYFEPEIKYDIKSAIHLSLCQKFVEEHHDFDSLLKWLTIATRNHYKDLSEMISALISNKFYFKWNKKFPENARNVENSFYRDVFGLKHHDYGHKDLVEQIFASIENTFMSSLSINIILP